MVSVERLKNRMRDFRVNDWLLDSGAFSQLKRKREYGRRKALEL
jgi:hypothetical protein